MPVASKKKIAPEAVKELVLNGTRKQRITQLLKRIEEQLNVRDMKITLADFIRLTQLERELEQEEQPKEIIITWKDPSETLSG